LKIAYFRACDEREDQLIGALSRRATIGVFVDKGIPTCSLAGVTVHDLQDVHYRNVLFEYDVVVYRVTAAVRSNAWYEVMCEWPGIAAIDADDLEALLAREPMLRRGVCERSLARVVSSPATARWLRDDNPWVPVFVVAPPAAEHEIAGAIERAIEAESTRSRAVWLRALLEAACTELPGYLPADPAAPWRADIDELTSLLAPPRMK
jgi:hypothetical protein